MAIRLGPAQPRGIAWNGAGGWLIFSQARQVNFSRPILVFGGWITFQRRGITSSVSVFTGKTIPRIVFWSGSLFAHFHDPVRATAGAGGRGLDHNPLARQVIGKGVAHRMAAREGAHRAGLFSRLAGSQDIFGCRRLQLLKLQFQLIDQPGAPLRRDAVFVTAQFGDLELEFLDHRLRAGDNCTGLCQLAFRNLRTGLGGGQGSA